MGIYQTKDLTMRKLDGSIAKFGPCTIVVEDSGLAKVNVLGNTVPNVDGRPGGVDRMDYITSIDRLEFQVSG